MKKIALSLLSILILFNILPSNSVSASINSNDQIVFTLKQYFSTTLETQNKKQLIKNTSILPNSDLAKYRDLHSQIIVGWSNVTGEKVEDYTIDVIINSMEEIDNYIKVDVDNVVNLKYKGTNFDSSYIENHIVYLIKNNNDFLIEKDIFEIGFKAKDLDDKINSTDGGYTRYIQDKILDLSQKSITVSEDAQNFKKSCESKPVQNLTKQTRATYNGQAAANWAYNNVYSAEDYNNADCTNFVSKAIRNGGMPTDGNWYQGSVSWINVKSFRNWVLNGHGVEYYSYSSAQIGDVIQYYNKSKADWTHSVIVTAKDNWSSYPYVCAHTSPQRNVLASYYYPNGSTFSDYRVLDIRG